LKNFQGSAIKLGDALKSGMMDIAHFFLEDLNMAKMFAALCGTKCKILIFVKLRAREGRLPDSVIPQNDFQYCQGVY